MQPANSRAQQPIRAAGARPDPRHTVVASIASPKRWVALSALVLPTGIARTLRSVVPAGGSASVVGPGPSAVGALMQLAGRSSSRNPAGPPCLPRTGPGRGAGPIRCFPADDVLHRQGRRDPRGRPGRTHEDVQAVLPDFGVGPLMAATDSRDVIVGTPACTSPKQAPRRRCGRTIRHLLTGRDPVIRCWPAAFLSRARRAPHGPFWRSTFGSRLPRSHIHPSPYSRSLRDRWPRNQSRGPTAPGISPRRSVSRFRAVAALERRAPVVT